MHTATKLILFALIAACNHREASQTTTTSAERKLATPATVGTLEVVATFDGPMPTGVTVSHAGRIFVNFPKWGDDVPFTVAEVRNGKPEAFPDMEANRGFVSVQSVRVDPRDRLWVLDTGSINMGKTQPGGPKLVGIDLGTKQAFKTIVFPPDVALPTTYLNDVRFDLTRGKAGTAYITDSSTDGPNGIIVVDLDSGHSWRKLHDHPSTKADKSFVPIVEGQPLEGLSIGSDGIALSADGKTLYYCPLSSRRLYSVSTDALANEKARDPEVKDLGEKGASDGLEADAEGRIYATNYEANAILRRKSDGKFETIAADPRMLWPDTMALSVDGYLYFTANQLERQAKFHGGRDLREKPYVLFKTKVDGTRILTK
jgi:sugar lactone lactonase YvrE